MTVFDRTPPRRDEVSRLEPLAPRVASATNENQAGKQCFFRMGPANLPPSSKLSSKIRSGPDRESHWSERSRARAAINPPSRVNPPTMDRSRDDSPTAAYRTRSAETAVVIAVAVVEDNSTDSIWPNASRSGDPSRRRASDRTRRGVRRSGRSWRALFQASVASGLHGARPSADQAVDPVLPVRETGCRSRRPGRAHPVQARQVHRPG